MAEKLECQQNLYPIIGTIYALPVRTVAGKVGTKNEGKTYEFKSIILEVKRNYKGKDYVELPEYELGFGVSIDDYAVGDYVQITFSCTGKAISESWHKTVLKAIFIKFADRDSKEQTVGGKSAREIRREEKAEKEVFVGAANPLEEEDDDFKDLPFILTIPIAIGIFSSIMI
jgi:hypothetical protein